MTAPDVNAADVAAEVAPIRMQMARAALSLKDVVAKELKRRATAREFQSTLFDPEDAFHALTLTNPMPPFIVFYGGRDARKSWAIAEALVRRANSMSRRILCTRSYQNSIADSVHALLSDMIYRLGLDHRFDVGKTSIRNPHTGSEFIFKGLQKPNEIKSTEGIDDLWVAEAQDVPDPTWEIVEPTIRKEGSQIIIDFNVTDLQAATHRRYVTTPPPGAVVHMVNYDSNRFLSQRSRDKIEHLKATDFDAYLHVYKGVPRQLSEAVIFKNWEVKGFDEEGLFRDCLRAGGRAFYGMDHGFAHDPYAIIRFFMIPTAPGSSVFDLYITHEAFGWKTEFAGAMAPGLNDGDGDRGELEQLIDTVPGSREWPIKADNSRPETISFCRNKGFNVTAAAKWDGCVEDGIAFIKGFRKVYIHTRCRHMAEEARLYSYKVDLKQIDPRTKSPMILPVVVDRHNHGWDAIRYGLDGYIQQSGELQTWAKLAG